MKQNNGSLQLWLWTLTPLLFILSVVSNMMVESSQLVMATYTLGTLTLISHPIRKRILEGERDSINDVPLKVNGDIFNVVGTIVKVVLFFIFIAVVPSWIASLLH